jgi:hypothetical protein
MAFALLRPLHRVLWQCDAFFGGIFDLSNVCFDPKETRIA